MAFLTTVTHYVSIAQYLRCGRCLCERPCCFVEGVRANALDPFFVLLFFFFIAFAAILISLIFNTAVTFLISFSSLKL